MKQIYRILSTTGLCLALAAAPSAFAQTEPPTPVASVTTLDVEALRNLALTDLKPIPAVPAPFQGRYTPEGVELGKMLYFDPRLSESHVVSCNTCHNLALTGVDNLPLSLGDRWTLDTRNAPTVFNSVFNFKQFWDGRADSLQAQASIPITNPIEMHGSTPAVIAVIKALPDYVERFKKAFPTEADPVTDDNVMRAIAMFESTLTTPNSAFDRFLIGDDRALSPPQLDGLRMFLDMRCQGCHKSVNLGGESFELFGKYGDPGPELRPPQDTGRFAITKDPKDKYYYKAPSLRNVANTAPYFHTGSVWKLEDAVKVMARYERNRELTDEQAKSIALFLESLNGEQPVITYPQLPPNNPDVPLPIK